MQESERWKIPLRLNHILSDTELNRWLHLFDSPKCKVTQAQDGRYYLTACRFEKLDKADEVKESASKLITMLIAFAKIELDIDFPSFEDVKDETLVPAVIENTGDSTNVTSYLETPKVYASAMQPTVEIREHGKVVTRPREARWWDYYLDQCDDSMYNTAAFKALSDFAQKQEPRTVRLTYETVRNDEGGKDEDVLRCGWVTRDELHRFTCSLNRNDIDSPYTRKLQQTQHVLCL